MSRLDARFLMAIWVGFATHSAQANNGDASSFNSKYGTGSAASRLNALNACNVCHTQSIPQLNPYGLAYKNAGRNSSAFQTIEPRDSDGDGSSNLDEIRLRFFPGDAADRPSPVITTQPQNQTVNLGANVIFTVAATGAAPLRYQWRFNQAPISGATSPTLTKNNVRDSDAGTYDVTASNSLGSVISAPANLQVTSVVTPFFHWAAKPTQTGLAGGRHVVMDKNGNAYVTGTFSGELNFGGVTVRSRGGSDIFVAKYDPNGKFDWLETAGGTNDDFATGVAVDAAGNCSVIGEFRGTIQLGDLSLTSSGGFDVFVVSYGNSGLRRWAWNFGGTNFDLSKAIAVDEAGDLYITGWFFERATFGASALTSSGSSDVFVAKLDGRSGGTVWAKSFGGSSDDNVGGIAADAEGNSYITGGFRTTASFGAFTLTAGAADAIYVIKLDNAGVVQWARKSGGNPFSRSPGIAVDRPGSVYVTGSFRGNAQFDNSAIASTGNDDEIFVAKYNNAGQLLWVTKAGGMGPDAGASVAGDGTGNCYVTGFFSGTASFDQTSLSSSGSSDLFVARYDGNGRLVWAKRAGGSQSDSGSSIAVDQDGNLYLTGGFSVLARFDEVNLSGSVGDLFVAKLSTRPFIAALQPQRLTVEVGQNVTFHVEAKGISPLAYQWKLNDVEIAGATNPTQTIANVTPTHAGAYTVVIDSPGGSTTSVKAFLQVTTTASSPAVLWASRAGGTGNEIGQGLVVDASGDAYLVGSFMVLAGFGGTSLSSSGSTDVFMAKYKSTGELLWARQDGGAEADAATSVAVDATGNAVMTGVFRGRATFGPSGIGGILGGTTLTAAAGNDVFITKYSPSGGFIWAKRAGGTGSDVGRGIAVERNGNVYVTGSYSSVAATFGTTVLVANEADSEEIFIAKYHSAGNVLWAKRAGGPGNDSGNGIAVDSAGNVFITGYFRDRVTFGLGDLIGFRVELTSRGNTDIFLAKYNSSGRLVWARQAGGVADDLSWGVALDPAGNPYVTGEILGDAMFGDIRLDSSSRDIFIAKYNSSGDALWAQRAGGHLSQSGAGIAVDGSGSAYVTGAFERSCFFGSPSSSNVTLESGGLSDIFAAKYDSTGKFVWARRLGGSGEDLGRAIAVDSSGRSYVTGYFSGTADFGGTTLSSSAGMDVFLARLAPAPLSGTAPAFQTLPTNQTVIEGSSVTFTAVVSGTAPLSFQWHKNGVALSGANRSTLTLTAARVPDSGEYTLVVTNSFGSVTSTPVTLTVMPPPRPPLPSFPPVVRGFTGSQIFNTFGQTKTPGEPNHCGEVGGASFWNQIQAEDNGVLFVSTEGSDFDTVLAAYSGPDPITSFDQLIAVACDNNSGADQKTSRIFFPATKGQLYYIAVDGVNGAQGKVQLAHELVVAPTIARQPTSQSVAAGADAMFSVEATGAPQSALPPPMSFQWQFNAKPIANATSATLTLNKVQATDGGNYSVVVTNAAGSVTSNPATLTVTGEPTSRTIQIGAVTGKAGSSVAIPITLNATGNENAISFSLAFSTSQASIGNVALGSGVSGGSLVVNDKQAASGQVGVVIALPLNQTIPQGSQQLAIVTLKLAAGLSNGNVVPVTFANSPAPKSASDAQGNDLAVNYLDGSVTVASGQEGDVAPRPNGNALVNAADVTVMGRIVAGLETNLSAVEFQRADCAPRSSLGNGTINTGDLTQVARYVAGLDPQTPSGGPSAPSVGPNNVSESSGRLAKKSLGNRRLSVANVSVAPSGTVTATVQMQTQGNENALSFSLAFDASKLTFTSVSLGGGASTASLVANTNQTHSGRIGVVVFLPVNQNLAAGTVELVKLSFVTGSSPASVALGFANSPAPESVSDTLGNDLVCEFADGTITIVLDTGRPSGDDFANRIRLSGPSVSVDASNVNATKETGEPNHAVKPATKSVWWSWIAPQSGNVTISTSGSSIDTLLAVYAGTSLANLTPVANNDDDPDGGSTSRVTFRAQAGTEYQIAVDGFGAEAGAIKLSILSQAARPSLRAELSGKNIILFWPTTATGFVIEASDSLERPSWTSVSLTPVVIGETNSAKIPISSGTKFYRLQSQ